MFAGKQITHYLHVYLLSHQYHYHNERQFVNQSRHEKVRGYCPGRGL